MTTYVAYLRVSTDRQGRSGLGLEAQQAAVRAFMQPGDRLIEPPYVEVESGRVVDRPRLLDALARCWETGATLLIAKLDPLARDVHFIAGLMKQSVPFVACDMPNATSFMLHIRAAVAEEERRAISQRTRAALAAAKARGTKLGGDRGYRPETPPDSRLGVKARQAEAMRAAHAALTAIEAARAGGVTTLGGIARALNDDGRKAPGGGAWTATAVRRVLLRVEHGNAAETAA